MPALALYCHARTRLSETDWLPVTLSLAEIRVALLRSQMRLQSKDEQRALNAEMVNLGPDTIRRVCPPAPL